MKHLLFPLILVLVALPCWADDDTTTEASFSVTPTTTRDTIANIGDKVLVTEFSVTQQNMESSIEVNLIGANSAQWTLEKNALTKASETVKVWYTPTKAGKHTAYVSFECADAKKSYTMVSLAGACIDPDNAPTITLQADALPQFTAQVGKSATDTIKFTTENCIDFVYASISPAGTGFTIDRSIFLKNTPSELVVDFSPTKEGTFSATVSIATRGGTTRTVSVTGVATAAGAEDQDWATVFNWDMNNPLPLLREDFESLTDDDHNKTLKIDRWQNVVRRGSRPWWGFLERSVPLVGDIEERCAKATGFVFGQEKADSAEMWLVTPPLDYVNAQSKLFTFRVRGDYMFDNHTSTIGLYYIDTVAGENLLMQKIDVDMPSTDDQNGEWFEFHVDLTGQNIADVFFMGFRYNGQVGNMNSVVYYIDDVSWGRTDIPIINTDSTQMTAITAPATPTTLGTVTATTKNLEERINLTLGGDHKSKFSLSTDTLGTEGGEFTVSFQSDDLGVHEAYVKLASRGAADKYVPMAVLVKEGTGIHAATAQQVLVWAADATLHIEADEPHQMAIYTADGRCVWHNRTASAIVPLPASGHYLIAIDGQTVKMTVR